MGYLFWIASHTPGVTRLAYRIPTFANIYICAAYVLLLLEKSPLRNTISDYGTPMSFISLSLVVPTIFIVTFLLLYRKDLDRDQLRYLRWSRILWVLQLIPALQISFFLYAWADGR